MIPGKEFFSNFLTPENLEKLTLEGLTSALDYLPTLFLAIVTLFLGLKIIRFLIHTFSLFLTKQKIDPSLITFLLPLLETVLKISLFISVASIVGVQTASFLAVLGSAGLAVGLALQGSLANFAGGVIILIFRPFRVGDHIEISGSEGIVQRISIFHTYLRSFDYRVEIIPNGTLANTPIKNFTFENSRRVEITVGISYQSDIAQARKIMLSQVDEHSPHYLHVPNPPDVVVVKLNDSSVDLMLRLFVSTPDYWKTLFLLTEKIKQAFDEHGIIIPFPQRDVHLYHHQPTPERRL